MGRLSLALLLVGVALSMSQDSAPGVDNNRIDELLNSDYFGKEEDEVTSKAPCLGCPVEVDVKDKKIQEIAGFAFGKHLEGFDGVDQGQQLVRVVNALRQVVAGLKYILDVEVGMTNCTKAQHEGNLENCQLDTGVEPFICNFEVVEQSWANTKEVVKSNCKKRSTQEYVDEEEQDRDEIDEDSEEVSVVFHTAPTARHERRKREAVKKVLGGSRDAEESAEKLMELAVFAMKQLDEIDADEDARVVVEVLDSKKKTVSGWLYDLKLRVAYTTCKEKENVTVELCKDKIIPPYRICEVKILFQPWQEVQRKVTESQCYPEKAFYNKDKKAKKMKYKESEINVKKEKSRLVGGFQDVDTKSEELQNLANFIVEFIDLQSNALHAQKLVKVLQAQRQVASGMKTKLVVEVGYTSCRKLPALDKSQCEIDEKREHQFCNVTVLEKPWLKSKQITQSKCGPRESMFLDRQKRSSFHDVFSPNDHKEFQKFTTQFNKKYESEKEYTYRLGIFKENMKKVAILQENEMGTARYGATIFADLTEEEFTQRHLGFRTDLKQGTGKVKQAKIPSVTLPTEFDWRNYSIVTPVKDQGSCGSCWAFSVTGNIEGLYAKRHGQLMSFSEQELVDCDTMDQGCGGGLPETAYKALEKLGGLETESAYPYEGRNDKCSFDRTKATAKVTGFVEMPKNESQMAQWLVKNGPISIGINANAMMFYMGGVSHPWKFLCSKKSLDHGVLIVGFGVHTTAIRHKILPYWIVKNSWGTGWGEKGYYRVFRGENTCGIAEMATSAVIE